MVHASFTVKTNKQLANFILQLRNYLFFNVSKSELLNKHFQYMCVFFFCKTQIKIKFIDVYN